VVRALRHDCARIGNCRFAGGKKRLEVNAGTMPTHGLMFIALLAGTVVLISVLNYVPALALGPVAEHLHCCTTLRIEGKSDVQYQCPKVLITKLVPPITQRIVPPTVPA
jgi:hypothetical protein